MVALRRCIFARQDKSPTQNPEDTIVNPENTIVVVNDEPTQVEEAQIQMNYFNIKADQMVLTQSIGRTTTTEQR